MLMSRGNEKSECIRDYLTIKSLIILENLEIHSELSFESIFLFIFYRIYQ